MVTSWGGCSHPEVWPEDRSKIALQEDIRAIAGAKGMGNVGALKIIEVTGRYHRICQYVLHMCFRKNQCNLRQALDLDLLGVPIACLFSQDRHSSLSTVLTNTPTSTLLKAQDPTWSLAVIVQSHLSTWEVLW